LVAGSSTVVGIYRFGAIFHDRAMFSAANRSSNFIQILSSEKSLGSYARLGISQGRHHSSWFRRRLSIEWADEDQIRSPLSLRLRGSR
jgi:hypothetical protein